MYNIIILFILLLIPTTVCNIIYPNPNPNFAKIIILLFFFFLYLFFSFAAQRADIQHFFLNQINTLIRKGYN